MTDAEIMCRLAKLPGWQRDGQTIAKEFVQAGFTEAVAFVGRIASVADALDHHPDVLIHRYRRVKITLTTHNTGGLTEKDFELAARIDEAAR